MRHTRFLLLAALAMCSTGCMVGPKYSRPAPASMPTNYHEAPPQGWKEAQPNDGKLRGRWWEMFEEPDLNALEEQVSISNQSVLQAEAQFRAARDSVRIARAALFPTISVGPSVGVSQFGSSSTRGIATGGGVGTTTVAVTPTTSGHPIRSSYDLPVDFSYQADIWGGIRRSVRAAAENAQASAAQLENARLTFQAELAQDYFQLRAVRSDEELLRRTTQSYREFLQLTRDRYAAGVASGGDVAQAETQLYGAETSLIDLEVARTQFEHAISILVGKAPTDIPSNPMSNRPPPVIPVGLPSALLEQRQDIAQAERQMAQVNEQIGILKVSYFPSLSLTASGGFNSSSFTQWLTWPSRFWSVGADSLEVLFDAGKRRAQVSQANALYDAAVANYRQVVLTAFQQVEDHLAALRVLENESKSQAATLDAAKRALDIATFQYKAGTNSYLQVITSQTAYYGAERTALDLLSRRMTTSVLLIEALGGGWDASSLPSVQSLSASK